jgi:uncharacterized protein
MSASNSNSSERAVDEIDRAQRAHEPSMEEILASIRNMIVDDSGKGLSPKPQPAAPTLQTISPKDAAPGSHGASGPPQRPDAPVSPAPIVWRRSQATPSESASRDLEPRDEALMSAAASEAAALSFGALSANLEVRSGELADSMMREMLRPMLKQWLDENLPSIVERLVRAEIERVARGGK